MLKAVIIIAVAVLFDVVSDVLFLRRFRSRKCKLTAVISLLISMVLLFMFLAVTHRCPECGKLSSDYSVCPRCGYDFSEQR